MCVSDRGTDISLLLIELKNVSFSLGNYSFLGIYFPLFAKFDTVIKVKGFQAPPAVIEGILLQSEMVADAAVIGIWYESEATEYPRAYIVVEPKFANEPNLVEKITNFVATRVAPHLRIKGGIRFIDVIPKS